MKKPGINNSLFLPVILLLVLACQGTEKDDAPVAILGAFVDEITLLEEELSAKEIKTVGGIRFLEGKLEGVNVVIAFTGIGKVNAAMTTGLLLEYFRPSGVIFTGIAGGINPELKPGDLVIAERCVQHDLNYIYADTLISYQPRNPIDGESNPVFIESDPRWLEILRKISGEVEFRSTLEGDVTARPQVHFGTIATGDAFVASRDKNVELIQRFNADAVEMEGAAVAQVCYQRGVPFIIIRSISDSADENAGRDLKEFYLTSAQNANRMVVAFLRTLKDQ